jgi:hypothetical protein
MLFHGIVHASHVTGLLSSIDGVTDAIDVQVAINKGDLEQEIVIIYQLHLINVQQLHDLYCLALRWDTTDIHSICQDRGSGPFVPSIFFFWRAPFSSFFHSGGNREHPKLPIDSKNRQTPNKERPFFCQDDIPPHHLPAGIYGFLAGKKKRV